MNTKDPVRKDKLLGLQHIRGIASLVVANSHMGYWADHATWTPAADDRLSLRLGHVAVFAFFCLSGVVIMLAHHRELGAPRELRPRLLAAFWIKRIFRIYPTFWLWAGINYSFYLWGFATPDSSSEKMRTIGDWVLASGLMTIRTPVMTAWSLYHEVLFYAVFSLFLVSRRLGWVIAGLLTCLTAISLFHRLPMSETVLNPLHIFFILGVVLFKHRNRLAANVRLVRLGKMLFWAPLLLVAFNYPDAGFMSVRAGKFVNLLLLLAGTFLLFVPYVGKRSAAESEPSKREAALADGLGNISYALYLAHIPIQALLYHWLGSPNNPWKYALYLIAPIAVAALNYRFFERPFLEWGHRLAASIKPRPAAQTRAEV
jgi:peptidoglycan/LPS O-acetylase OafA/YrhL